MSDNPEEHKLNIVEARDYFDAEIGLYGQLVDEFEQDVNRFVMCQDLDSLKKVSAKINPLLNSKSDSTRAINALKMIEVIQFNQVNSKVLLLLNIFDQTRSEPTISLYTIPKSIQERILKSCDMIANDPDNGQYLGNLEKLAEKVLKTKGMILPYWFREHYSGVFSNEIMNQISISIPHELGEEDESNTESHLSVIGEKEGPLEEESEEEKDKDLQEQIVRSVVDSTTDEMESLSLHKQTN